MTDGNQHPSTAGHKRARSDDSLGAQEAKRQKIIDVQLVNDFGVFIADETKAAFYVDWVFRTSNGAQPVESIHGQTLETLETALKAKLKLLSPFRTTMLCAIFGGIVPGFMVSHNGEIQSAMTEEQLERVIKHLQDHQFGRFFLEGEEPRIREQRPGFTTSRYDGKDCLYNFTALPPTFASFMAWQQKAQGLSLIERKIVKLDGQQQIYRAPQPQGSDTPSPSLGGYQQNATKGVHVPSPPFALALATNRSNEGDTLNRNSSHPVEPQYEQQQTFNGLPSQGYTNGVPQVALSYPQNIHIPAQPYDFGTPHMANNFGPIPPAQWQQLVLQQQQQQQQQLLNQQWLRQQSHRLHYQRLQFQQQQQQGTALSQGHGNGIARTAAHQHQPQVLGVQQSGYGSSYGVSTKTPQAQGSQHVNPAQEYNDDLTPAVPSQPSMRPPQTESLHKRGPVTRIGAEHMADRPIPSKKRVRSKPNQVMRTQSDGAVFRTQMQQQQTLQNITRPSQVAGAHPGSSGNATGHRPAYSSSNNSNINAGASSSSYDANFTGPFSPSEVPPGSLDRFLPYTHHNMAPAMGRSMTMPGYPPSHSILFGALPSMPMTTAISPVPIAPMLPANIAASASAIGRKWVPQYPKTAAQEHNQSQTQGSNEVMFHFYEPRGDDAEGAGKGKKSGARWKMSSPNMTFSAPDLQPVREYKEEEEEEEEEQGAQGAGGGLYDQFQSQQSQQQQQRHQQQPGEPVNSIVGASSQASLTALPQQQQYQEPVNPTTTIFTPYPAPITALPQQKQHEETVNPATTFVAPFPGPVVAFVPPIIPSGPLAVENTAAESAAPGAATVGRVESAVAAMTESQDEAGAQDTATTTDGIVHDPDSLEYLFTYDPLGFDFGGGDDHTGYLGAPDKMTLAVDQYGQQYEGGSFLD